MAEWTEKIQRMLDALELSAAQRAALETCLAERVQAEETLRSNEARLRTILDTTVDGIITIDTDGTVMNFNRAAERIFAYAADEVIGRNVSMLMPPPFSERHDKYIRHYLETGEARIIGIGREVEGQRKDGSRFPMDLAVSQFWVEGSRYFTGIVRDISERKRLQEAVVSVSEGERQIIGQELHDALGQQLTGINLMAKALEKRLQAERHAAAKEARRISTLAREAVTEAKNLAHGLYPTVLEKHGINLALEEFADTQGRLHNVECTYRGARGTPRLDRTTALHLYRIAQEATHNAITHGQARRVTLSLHCDDRRLELVVADDGQGMPEDAETHGGLGLEIMRYRARMIGGTFDIVSELGKGTMIRCVRSGPVNNQDRPDHG